ncbi:hypothetical protein HOLleu_01561 [Holothuria leucospilota]|uniref:Uncharacterized protein n=1 Tax=Holothuria leucospilota TaxID=206669 RepID=A0A9Q1HL03_HOLLE|nr:hypothetical protein HOLleu_01561 [Holothuria leucospilota]
MGLIRQNKHTLILLSLGALCVFNEFSNTEGKEFPAVLKSRITLVAGFFPISKDTVMNELRKRTSKDECSRDFKFYFDDRVQADMELSSSEHVVSLLYTKYDHSDIFGDSVPCHVNEAFAVKDEYLWMFVPFLNVDEEGTATRTFCYGAFTDSQKEVFLPTCGNNIYRIDSLNIEGDRLVLRNGTDQLVMKMTYDPDCVPAEASSAESWHDVRESPIFPLSGPFDSGICDTLGPNVSLCQMVKQNSCLLSRTGQDYCFRHDNVGPTTRCRASIQLLEMTGSFRRLSMIETAPPIKALQAERLYGNRSIAMLAPCLTGIDQ